MSHPLLQSLAVTLLGLALIASTAKGDSGPKTQSSGPGSYKRIVLLKFKDGTPPHQVDQLLQGIRQLGPKIPAIATLDVARDTSTQNLNQGFTHAVLLTFHSQSDRATFLADSIHKQYETEVLDPHLDKVLVVEFNSSATP